MPQQTNLNVSPYFDDFDANNDYYRVLFKPGYPVQARELTTLQSILQNQIEKFGQHFFKEGAKVIPGNTSYNRNYNAVLLNNSFLGVPIEAYIGQLIGAKITGSTSGVTAVIDSILSSADSERGTATLYVNYLASSSQNNSSSQFLDGENLFTDIDISSGLIGNSVIPAGEPFATTISNSANALGSSFSISNGVYFIRGQFVSVEDEVLILDQYNNNPSYRIGFFVNEEIITSDIDETLNDNSQGFNNYSAPGADRLRITATLFKKSIDDFNDANFIELATIRDGSIRSQASNSEYSYLIDELARRTYHEMGDYYISPFTISARESLNNRIGNQGIFSDGQLTYNGSIPSDDLGVYEVSSGKAVIRGYDVETLSPTFLDFPKTRTTKTLVDQSIDYNTGSTFILNRLYGSPTIGVGNTYYVSLRDSRVGTLRNSSRKIGVGQTFAPGKEIGVARVYDMRLESGSYDSEVPNSNRWNISLYDIQTITEITVNEPITLTAPVFIKGSNSGATAFLKESVSAGTALTVYQKSGDFLNNENLSFDTFSEGRVAVAITNYGISNIKSIYGSVGSANTFSADIIQSNGNFVGLATIGEYSYFENELFLESSLSQDVGVGSSVFYIDNVTDVAIGSSISIGSVVSNANIVAVGNTFVTISTASTVSGSTLPYSETSVEVSETIGVGSTIIYLSSIPLGVIGNYDLSQSRISIGFTGQNGPGLVEAPIVSVGNTFVLIGTAATVSTELVVETSSAVAVGDTFIGITPSLPGSISVGSSVIVGTAITGAPVTYIGAAGTGVYIGIAYTTDYSESAGVAVTFSNLSPMVVGSAVTFTNVSQTLSGISVTFSDPVFASKVVSPNTLFPGNIVSVDDLVSYTTPSLSSPVIAKVVSVGSTHVNVIGVSTVANICEGQLPSSTIEVSDLNVLTTRLENSEDNTLYTLLPKRNISNVDLTDASLVIRKTYTVNIASNRLSSSISADTNESFLPFDAERYTLIRSNGQTEVLTSDKFSFTNAFRELQIYNLGANDTGATLVASLRKVKPKAKVKIKNRVNSIIVDKSTSTSSGLGATTLDDGLLYGDYPYGTRVQDEIISLNNTDIIGVLGIFESPKVGVEPSAPTAILSTISGPSSKTSDLIIGERFVGQTTGAVAIVAERINDTQISYILENQIQFREGESVRFQESNIQSVISTLQSISSNISGNYTYTNGQTGTHYDYGTLIRKSGIAAPSRKIKVYFSNGYYESTDDGDITTTNSYNTFDYSREIQTVNNVRNTDIIDIRPKVSEYSVSTGSRSPLEFFGRVFSGSGNSAANILAADETILTDFSFYLGRIDRIFLSKDGKFQIKFGTPSEKPERPITVDDSIEIASAYLPPYLYSVKDISLEFLQYKRYQMKDIRQLENRIKNLEYYTALSLLETDTSNLFIADSQGLNRFKSGFFVDNFSSLIPQEERVEFKNSIDLKNKELRPQHYTTSIDLQPYSSITFGEDSSIVRPDGINVRRNEDIVTLDYGETEWLRQSFATKSESVTPFLISFWQGTIELTPSSDTWIDTVRLDARIINTEGNFAETMALASRTLNVDPQTGFAPTLWGSWETVWTGQEIIESTRERTITTGGNWRGSTGGGLIPIFETVTNTTVREGLREVRDTGVSTRSGNRTVVVEQIDTNSIGDRVVSRDLIPFMRSRNITFNAKRLKPSTEIYAFFDGRNVTSFCVPKLLEISMISGTFQVGETVVGTTRQTGLGENWQQWSPSITFRVAQSNHREGPYYAPTITYPTNPYDNSFIQSSYSSTSSLINVDLYSLSNQPEGEFGGWVSPGMILVGQTSGAQATVSNLRLVTDIAANLQGSFYIPNPNIVGFPRFEAGSKSLRLINNTSNNIDTATTVAEEGFSSQGNLETVQENIISVRNARIENQTLTESEAAFRTTGTTVVSTEVLSSSSSRQLVGYYDPLAQSFFVDDETGIFLTRCDVYFRSVDDMDIPVTLQIRTVELGTPTQKVLPFSEVVKDPIEINTSGDGSVATSFVFSAPVYLEGGKEYAITLLSNSAKYSVYIARIGENDLITQEYISNPPYLGSLFKSQNASTWDASQWEDLKFTLYRADFIDSGTVEYYNPTLTEGNGQVPYLTPNPLVINSRRIRVGLGSTLVDSDLKFGNTIIQDNTNASGNYVGGAGAASTTTLRIINAGIGYTPSFDMGGSYTYSDVSLETITGSGTGALANITITEGVAVAATISNGGRGYQVGDIVGVTSLGTFATGTNARFSIVSIASTNELVLDNVQGDFLVGVGNTVRFINSLGVTTSLNSTVGGGVTIGNITAITDGLHIKVNHKNHGMYFEENLVTIGGVEPDVIPTKLTAPYNSDSTGNISVESIADFGTFEGVGVGTTNSGWLLVGDEIIKYSAVGSGQITSIVRGSNPKNHPTGTPVRKYELGGVSLLRINKTHNLEDVTISDPITFDSYNVKLDMTQATVPSNFVGISPDPSLPDRSVGTSFPKLYLNQTKSTGGPNITATQNIPYEIITPMIHNVTVRGTSLSGQIRTVSGKSISGNEIPYTDQGFETISINQTNYLSSSRLIPSAANASAYLGSLPNNKSFNMRLLLNTTDSRVSPVIDIQRSNIILTSNRVNSVITNYAEDSRVNTIFDDPTAFQYISKENVLETPASSLQIILDAYVNTFADIRAFYSIDNNENSNPIFIPFPGWDNINNLGQVINSANNSGRSDIYIAPTSKLGFSSTDLTFKEYKFTVDNLPDFRSYRIKIVMTSTNQTYPPRFKNLRVIALA